VNFRVALFVGSPKTKAALMRRVWRSPQSRLCYLVALRWTSNLLRGSMSFPIQGLCQLAFLDLFQLNHAVMPKDKIWALTICSSLFALQQGNLRNICAMHKIRQCD